MRITNILRLRIRSLLSRKTVEQELDEELRYHLERQIDENIATGMSRDEARYATLQSIKDIEQRKEKCRDARGLNAIDNTIQDLRYTFRQLRKNPGFACTAILVLALGISATVAMFGFVDAALIQPLPYRDQSRLVAVFESSPGYPRSMVSYRDFVDWKRLNNVFSSIDAYALNGGFTLSSRNGAEQVPGTRVSAGFFHTLGATPVLGRGFRKGEDSPAAPRTVILSYKAWQERFGGEQDVLGKTITLNGAPTTIIGVLPRNFQFALYGDAEFWGNLRASGSCEQNRECHNLITIARLNDGISARTASADMQSIVRQLRSQYPESNRDFGDANLVPLRDLIIGDVRPILLVLLCGAGLLLLISGVNVITLLLARCDKRGLEIAVRGALGASSLRLFQQFAIEGFVLAGFGGSLGLLFAQFSRSLLVSLIPADKMAGMPYLHSLEMDPLTILFACCIWIFAGVLFAVIPVARTSLSRMLEGLKEGARGSTGTMWRRFGSNLVIVEIAITMVLMVGAGLLGTSLYLLLHVDVGFRSDHLALLETRWPSGRYETDRQKIVLEQQILDRISKLPGVTSVALSLTAPVGPAWGTASFHIAGLPNREEHNEVLNRQVSSGYFSTLQARLVRGRYFREDEGDSKPLVAIVNQALAKKYFPGIDAVGKQIYYDWAHSSKMQIIGVVDNIKEGPLDGVNMPALYVPYDQHPVPWPTVLVRTAQREAALLPDMTRVIHKIDPFISVSGEGTMAERIDGSPSAYLHRSAALLVGAFAAAAFLLSIVGLYGVVAYSVSQRTREIGIRIALGAERRTVYRLILKEAGRLTALGVLLGLAFSLAAATLMRNLLFGVRPWDAATLVIVAAALTISALLASFIPARRAASVNPMEALRAE